MIHEFCTVAAVSYRLGTNLQANKQRFQFLKGFVEYRPILSALQGRAYTILSST